MGESRMKWFKSFGDNEAMIDEKQFKILTKKLKLPKLSPAYGGVEFLDKTFGSNSDALSITKESNNEYRVTARTDKVKAEVNKALGIKESTIQSFANFNEEEKIFEEWLAEQDLDEVVTTSTRIKMKQAFKKNKAKIMRGRKMAEKKPASPEKLKDRAMKQARTAFTKKILGGKDKSELSLADRANLERKLAKKKPAIAKLAKKLLPQVKVADRAKRSANKQESVTEAIAIGKEYEINKFDTLKNMRSPESVKVIDYIKKPGKDPQVVYSLNGKEKTISAKVFKKMMVEAVVTEANSGRQYFKVAKALTVYQSTGANGIFTQYRPLKLKKNDQLHLLPGGNFAVSGPNKSYGHFQFTNPNDDNEMQHHGRNRNTGLNDLVMKKKIIEIPEADKYHVDGPKYR